MEKNNQMSIASSIISVYSESPGERDYLRNKVSACGLNAICFETENTCIDNFKAIKPKMVIVHTDSVECVWRFLFSIHLEGFRSPLILLSEHLKPERFSRIGQAIPIHAVPNHHQGVRLAEKITELGSNLSAGEKEDTMPLFVGESEATRQIISRLPNIARSRDSVLIVGEKGTGKELLSRIIVEASGSNKRLVKVDCGALEPRVLVNGAIQDILSREHNSELTTVLFDKIHLIPLDLQSDLLLLVDETQRLEVGESKAPRGGVRFIATSEKRIDALVQKGTFRKDLYYRLNVIALFLTPLRHRKADISQLTDFFVIDACVKNNKSILIPSQKTREMLFIYHWPGNADELYNYMRRVAIEGNESCIWKNHSMYKTVKNSNTHLLNAASVEELPKPYEIKDFIPTAKSLSLRSICDEFVSRTERRLMRRALESTNWNRKKAAELLNISYKSMLNKIKAYDII